MNYPTRPVIPNPYQIAGQAVGDIGGQVQQYGKEQDALQAQFQAMLEKRAQAALAQQNFEQEQALKTSAEKRAQDETDQKKELHDQRMKFLSRAPADGTGKAAYSDAELQNALASGVIDAQTYKDLKPETPKTEVEVGGALYHRMPDGSFKQVIAPKPDGFAGITRAQVSTENNLRGHNSTDTKDYEMTKRAALAFQADYDNYRRQIASGDKEAIRVAQQGMLDKYITASTNKSTGDAQFRNFAEGQGLQSSIDNLYDKVVHGSMAPDVAIRTMRDITMSTAMKMNEKVKQTNTATQTQANAVNKAHNFSIDPAAVITHPPDMLSQDSVTYAQPSFDNNGNGSSGVTRVGRFNVRVK